MYNECDYLVVNNVMLQKHKRVNRLKSQQPVCSILHKIVLTSEILKIQA